MFKKFHPKEDVSSSTSLKSSVQRGIRSSLLTQMPFLTQPAYKQPSSTSTSAPAAEGGVSAEDAAAQADDQGDDSEDEGAGAGAGKKGKGKGGKGKGGGKGGKKGKGKDKEDKKGKGDKEEEEEGDGELLVIDEIWPKKEALGLTKCHDRISIYTIAGTPLFFNHFDGPYVPTMKLLHKYPAMLPHVRIDRGAIKFLLAGANMMAPGLLSPGGDLPDGLEKDAIVAIHAEGKDTACGIGKMAESSEAIKKAGKGVAIEVICWIGDDLWKVDSIGL